MDDLVENQLGPVVEEEKYTHIKEKRITKLERDRKTQKKVSNH